MANAWREDFMGQRNNRHLLAASGGQASVERRQERVRLLDRCPGSLNQRATQIAITIANAGRLALAALSC
jgi:hypothetical protein